MEKYITDETTGLKYELVGDCYYLAGDDKPEEHRPIGIWGGNGIFAASDSAKRQYTRHW